MGGRIIRLRPENIGGNAAIKAKWCSEHDGCLAIKMAPYNFCTGPNEKFAFYPLSGALKRSLEVFELLGEVGHRGLLG